MTYYVKYYKTNNGYKAEGFSKVFKTVRELKQYFNKTSAYNVKFIRK